MIRTFTWVPRRASQAWACGALLWAVQGLSLCAADESQGAGYIGSPGSASPMINGPACLATQQLASSQCQAGTHREFIDYIEHWRAERRIYTGYEGSRYDSPALKWTQSSFIQPQTIVEDRFLYDPAAQKYTVDRYLDDVERRYGGIDSILIWPVYPNLGIDNRNQLDMIRAMPGGVAGVKQMVADFHRRGVRVLFPMNMWDQGTRDPGKPWPQAIAELMAEVGADGVNGDTQDGVPLVFSQAADATGHPLAFQPQDDPSDEALAWNVMSWWEDPSAQWEGLARFEQFVPRIDRYKWLEPRHMANITDRWGRQRTGNLQVAFINGIGWESWENIWGIWNGITPRDAEAARRMASIERGTAAFLVSPGWEPFYPMRNFGVFASRWPLKDQTLWTIVNRNEYTIEERQMAVPFREGEHYLDLYHGVELQGRREGGETVLSFTIEAQGFGAVLATRTPLTPEVLALMKRMKAMTQQPLSQYSGDWHPLQPHLVAAPPQTVRAASGGSPRIPPDSMLEVPAGEFDFTVQGIEIEGGDEIGVDVSYPWEDSARRFHQHLVKINRFYIDRFPVTNAQFKTFLAATHYHPKDDLNFLKDWKDGTFPDGWANKPVTWVSLEDARAYAQWAGKRLPHEWEWQYAAQGTDGRSYPWGNEWKADAVPFPERGRNLRGPDEVGAHPLGASPFGVMDMVGNVWQWTDEYADERTRAAILRGGSYYMPRGSPWYFPQAYRNDQHGKLLLMAPSKDRAATLGFRCAADAG
jgi:iron(II)-dependent oxidoreductase